MRLRRLKMRRNYMRGVNALICAAASLAMLLTGCNSNANVVEHGNTVSVEVSWWGNDIRHEYTMDAMDLFMDKHPDIAVSCRYGVWQGYEKRNQVAMKSDTEADVMQINYAWISQYSNDGNGYYDLYQLSDIIDLSQFKEEDLQYGIVNGKLNALPIALNTPELFYNKTIWDKYGLEYPQKWDDFYTAAAVMSEDGIYPLGMVKKQLFMMSVARFEQLKGKEFFLADGTLNANDSDISGLLLFYKELLDQKVLMPIDDFDRGKFADGKVAGTMCWVSDSGNYCSALAEKGGEPEIGGVIIEKGAKLSGWYIKPSCLLAISKNTDNPEAAAELLNFMINSSEMASLQKSEKGVPVSRRASKTVAKENDEKIEYEFAANNYMIENRDSMSIIKTIMEDDDIITAYKSCGDDFYYGVKTLDDATRILKNSIMTAVRKNKL